MTVSNPGPNSAAASLFQHSLTIPVPFGFLEGRLLFADSGHQGPGAILCPPHPLLAGNMDNNVIAAIATLLAAHCPVLLFNYRGVGRSDTPRTGLPLYELWKALDADGGYREIIDDVRRVFAYGARLFQGIHLIGYSFGSYMGLMAAGEQVVSFSAIAPPLTKHDFSLLASLAIPSQVILAEKDSLAGCAMALPERYSGRCQRLPACDHFFRTREVDVARLIHAFIVAATPAAASE